MRKLALVVMLLFMLTSLTGCLSFNPNSDSLMRPPQLTPDQRDVYNALVSAAGSDISLVYPKRGNNRSAFMFPTMDEGKGSQDALAFYTSKDTDVRIAFFSKIDGVWKIKDDLKTIGSQVDTVEFSDDKIYVGLLLGQKKDYSLYVYTLSNNKLRVYYPDSYTSFALCDIDNDGSEELMMLNQSAAVSADSLKGTTQSSTLRMIKDVGNTMQTISSVSLDPSVTQYVKLTSGKMADGNTALYLDGKVGPSSMSTQIVVYRDGRLQNPLYGDGSTSLTLRSQLIPSRISPLGNFVEIPCLVPLPGYENVTDTNKVYLTQWQQYSGGKMSVVHTQFVSLYFGFALEIPSRWLGQVTAKLDYETSEIRFYKYTGNIDSEGQEYLRIRVIDSSNKNQGIYEGYTKVKFAGTTDYMAIVTGASSDPLTMSIEEVTDNFSIFGW